MSPKIIIKASDSSFSGKIRLATRLPFTGIMIINFFF